MTVTEEVFDRRVRRSRNALRAAVIDLVAVMAYDKITVADILLRADVARGTFYSHYADRDALFGDAVAALMSELVHDVAQVASRRTTDLTGLGIRVVFQHAQDHRDLYLSMLSGAAAGVPLGRYTTLLAQTFAGYVEEIVAVAQVTPRMPVDAIASCWMGEQVALTSWWLREAQHLGVDEVTRMRLQLMTGGAAWAYGLQPGQLTFADSLPSRRPEAAVDALR